MCDNKILCEYDYEERMVFANLAYNSSQNLASQMKVGLKALDLTFEFDETVILTRLHAALVAANKAAREAEAAEAAADAEQVD